MGKSINRSFDGSHFHHMHIIGDHEIGIYIPDDIHQSIYHNGKTGQGMRAINKAALLWLCEQPTIKETKFDVNNTKITGERILIEENTVNDLRELGKDFGETVDDVTIRLVMSKYKQLKAENELLKMKLEECEKKSDNYSCIFKNV